MAIAALTEDAHAGKIYHLTGPQSLTHVEQIIGPDARYLHQGLTSSAMLDTTLALQLRTASDLLPPDIEMVRIVDIDGIDMQADGGTHVASTAMIGRIAVTKMESKGRGFRRLRIRIEDAQ